ncbi:MAG: hypothetical protein KDJ75_09175 [Alphaproteobacteria bacterium]|nr:hypothetical protein [Alphaproteobacteria bacterium]
MSTQYKIIAAFLAIFIQGVFPASGVFAAESQVTESVPAVQSGNLPQPAAVPNKSANSSAAKPVFKAADYPSLLFTYWEHTAIQDARRSVGTNRAPTEAELTRDLKTMEEAKVKPPPEKRDIRLGGIVYHSSDDWTIWLNGERVTPKALPEEIIDLRVFNEYIEVKWFDEYTNQIFPIRLRAHQRFNIDTRIFLPG